MSARIANNSTHAGAPPQPWEKQPRETPKRYEAFLVCMKMPISTRSIRASASEWRSSAAGAAYGVVEF